MNWQLYIAWADEILAIATQIIANRHGGSSAYPEPALTEAHDLVAAHVANLEQARQQQP